MKKAIFFLLAFLIVAKLGLAQTFSLVSTKLYAYNSEDNIYFDASNKKNFSQLNSTLENSEHISLVYQSGLTKEYGYLSVDKTQTSGDLIVSNSALINSLNNAGTIHLSFALVFEIRNTSGSSATLYYGFNPNISRINVPAGIDGYYQIELYETNAPVSSFREICIHKYESRNNTRVRGTAIANVGAGETVYIYLAISSVLVGGNGYNRIINANTSVAFSDSPINSNNDLGFAVLGSNDKMLFQIFNWRGSGDSGLPMGIPSTNAFQYLSWESGVSEGFGLAENVNVVDGCAGVSLEIWNTDLFSFEVWNNSKGDNRTYINGTAYVKLNGATVLTVKNIRFDMEISYPAPYGDGNGITASGWGEIDANNSNASWVTAFDPYGTGEVYFQCSSTDNPLEYYYNALIKVVPSPIERVINAMQIPSDGAVNFGDDLGLVMSFNLGSGRSLKDNTLQKNSGNYDGIKSANNRVMALAVYGDPGGDLPSGIQSIYTNKYWELGTTASNFTANLTFSLDGFNISNYSDIRMLKRESPDDDWVVLSNYSVNQDEKTITVTGITNFSQFSVGSTSDNPAPVELTNFSANVEQGKVVLNWETATEVNNYGFEIERSRSAKGVSSDASWETIGFVEGHGNSNAPKKYSFVDSENLTGKVKYRLKQIDLDGTFEYSSVVEVNVESLNLKFALNQNYPNPFNPTTKIEFTLPKSAPVRLSIYNSLGQEVKTLLNERLTEGKHTVEFDAKELPSGVYLYQLTSEKFTSTRKMILLK